MSRYETFKVRFVNNPELKKDLKDIAQSRDMSQNELYNEILQNHVNKMKENSQLYKLQMDLRKYRVFADKLDKAYAYPFFTFACILLSPFLAALLGLLGVPFHWLTEPVSEIWFMVWVLNLIIFAIITLIFGIPITIKIFPYIKQRPLKRIKRALEEENLISKAIEIPKEIDYYRTYNTQLGPIYEILPKNEKKLSFIQNESDTRFYLLDGVFGGSKFLIAV